MKNEWKRLQKDTLMKGKKTEDPPKIKSKQRDVQVEIVAEDDDGNSSDYEDIESGGNESDAVSVSSNDSHSNAIDGKLTKKKNRGQAAVMTKVLKKKKLKKTKKAGVSQVLMFKPGDRVVVDSFYKVKFKRKIF